MDSYEKTVFVSYAWGDEREEIVNQIDLSLQQRGMKIIRDKRDLGYKGSIKEFMKRIGQGACVIVVISDKYLRSPNCMFELVEISDNSQFIDRIFPVILEDADLSDPIKRLGYVKYWEEKENELSEEMKKVDQANLQGIRDDIDTYHRIRGKIAELASILKDLNALTPEIHRNTNFGILYDTVEKKIKSPAAAGTAMDGNARSGKNVGTVFMTLVELMKNYPQVGIAAIKSQTDFKVTHEQVDLLSDYKDLHDLLHELQMHCINGLVDAVGHFPPSEQTLYILDDHALKLEEIIDDLHKVREKGSMPKQELAWIDDIEPTKTDLRKAIDTLDEKLFKNVIWRLNRLLATQPARINVLLSNSARALRLPDLLIALTSLCNNFPPDLNAEEVKDFQSGIQALSKLNEELSKLVSQHSSWQTLDVELRRIESSIDRDLIELEMSWPDVKSKYASFYVDLPDEWARRLMQDSDAVDAGLINAKPANVRRGFRNYRNRVTKRFFLVDKQLKELCTELRPMRTPLAAVLARIE